MSHRAKHRHAALLRRVEIGRMIASDRTPAGVLAYERARLSLTPAQAARAFVAAFKPGKRS